MNKLTLVDIPSTGVNKSIVLVHVSQPSFPGISLFPVKSQENILVIFRPSLLELNLMLP